MDKGIHYVGAGVTLFMILLLSTSFNETLDVMIQEPEGTKVSPPAVLSQVITPVDLTRDYDFAGELVPPDNFDAMERLDRELSVNSYWHASTLLNLKATHRYFPVIEPILAKHGVPDDFKYLAVSESNLRNEASPAGAKGVWQFMGGTARSFGLEINSEVDERLHLEKATDAACRYLKDYYEEFGSWSLAAAAYNMGGPRLKRLIREQRATNYYELNLNSETSRYLFRVIALKEILRDPVAYGFQLEDNALYRPLVYDTVRIDGPVLNWGDFAREHGTTYRMLKVFNPWLVSSRLTNRHGKQYEIRIPVKG
jgi:hypothetical protein